MADPRARLKVLYDRVDFGMSLAGIAVQRAGKAISCSKGCDACCHFAVDVLPFEARAMLAHYEEQKGKEATATLLQRCRDQLTLTEHLSTREWFLERHPCVFLEHDRTCGVYAWRPLACRTYAVGSPAEDCSRDVRVDQLNTRQIDRMFVRESVHARLLPNSYGKAGERLPRALLRAAGEGGER